METKTMDFFSKEIKNQELPWSKAACCSSNQKIHKIVERGELKVVLSTCGCQFMIKKVKNDVMTKLCRDYKDVNAFGWTVDSGKHLWYNEDSIFFRALPQKVLHKIDWVDIEKDEAVLPSKFGSVEYELVADLVFDGKKKLILSENGKISLVNGEKNLITYDAIQTDTKWSAISRLPNGKVLIAGANDKLEQFFALLDKSWKVRSKIKVEIKNKDPAFANERLINVKQTCYESLVLAASTFSYVSLLKISFKKIVPLAVNLMADPDNPYCSIAAISFLDLLSNSGLYIGAGETLSRLIF